MLRERDIERYLVEQVKKRGGEVRKVKWIGRRSAPDRYVMLPGRRPVWVELKAPGKKPTAAQQREFKRLSDFSADPHVVGTFAEVDWLLA